MEKEKSQKNVKQVQSGRPKKAIEGNYSLSYSRSHAFKHMPGWQDEGEFLQ
jgi:hypothetical protein